MSSVLEDFTAIQARVKELKRREVQTCPIASSRTLYDCLRSAGRCPPNCPLWDCWLGPDVS